jgi:hypothetical protein
MQRLQCSANMARLAARSAISDIPHVLGARPIEETLAMNRIIASLLADPIKNLARLLVLASFWISAGAAHACSCDPISPEAGFDRAQYVFAGKVVRAEGHTWQVEVERVWKGHEKLGRSVRLMDVYATIDCEFFFQLGQRYLFFTILAKGGRNVFYHPQVCNWTKPLQSTRVPAEGNESLWLEDLIARDHGPGEPPRDEQR